MNIKKTLLISSIAAAMGVTTAANAAFTPLVDGHYKLEITGGCFGFGNCVTGGTGALTDNTTVNQADTSGLGTTSTYGSGIINDGLMGVIDFTLAGGSISVTSFSQDAYQGTAGGTFYLRSTNNTTMGGTITGSTMSFDPTGRQGLAANFITALGEQPWNYDNYGSTAPNATNTWVTGTSTNRGVGLGKPFTLTGSVLQNAVAVNGANAWSGTLVSTGNIGTAWGTSFQNTQFSEQFKIKLVAEDPVANDDIVTGTVGQPITINISDLLNNDAQADNLVLTPSSFTQPTQPNSSIVANSTTLTYTPAPSLAAGIGVDSFTYTIQDTNTKHNPATATVNITLTALGAIAPVAKNDSVTTLEDKPVSFNPVSGTGSGIGADTDANPGQTATLVISAFDKTSAKKGTVTNTPGTNTLTYTPATNYHGSDTFTYKVKDTTGLISNVATVSVNVTFVNHVPVCSNVTLTTGIDKTLTIDAKTSLVAKCKDVDVGDTSSFDNTTQPVKGGTLASSGAGTWIYKPAKGFMGNDSFTYTVKDKNGGVSKPATVTIKVGPQFGNFTMLNASPGGTVFGGTNDVVFTWDNKFNTGETDTNFGHMTIASVKPQPFFGFVWKAHNIRVFGPGTYKFDTTCTVADYKNNITVCNHKLQKHQKDQFITMTVGPNQIGAHMLFDWSTAKNIDVVNVWNKDALWNRHGKTGAKDQLFQGAAGVAPLPTTVWALVSTDANGDGFNGSPMVDGPFMGYYANFNAKVILPPGSKVGQAGTSNAKPYVHVQSDTKVGSGLASLSILSLFAALTTLLGLRRFGKRNNNQ